MTDNADDRLNLSYTKDVGPNRPLDKPPLTPIQEARIDRILRGDAPSELSVEQLQQYDGYMDMFDKMFGTHTVRPPAIKVQYLGNEPYRGEHRIGDRAYSGDAGWDLTISRPAHVLVDGITDLHTDIAIALPPGYFGRITGRSSTLRRRGLLVNEGIVDAGYRGELFIAVFNLSGRVVEVKPGERLAQLLIHKVIDIEWQVTDLLPESERGENGFGSTGR